MTYPFLQAKYYTKGRGGHEVKQCFIHTTESQKIKGGAWRIWRWFFGRTSPKASAHLIIDATAIEQNVKLGDTAWAVDDWLLNQTSVSFELVGSASQTPSEWADVFSQAVLHNAAKVVAEVCFQFKIPAVKLTPIDILLGKKGIAGHWDVTLAKKIRGGHTDPGKNFPWAHFIQMVQHELATIR